MGEGLPIGIWTLAEEQHQTTLLFVTKILYVLKKKQQHGFSPWGKEIFILGRHKLKYLCIDLTYSKLSCENSFRILKFSNSIFLKNYSRCKSLFDLWTS
jgi:hypothetical protein